MAGLINVGMNDAAISFSYSSLLVGLSIIVAVQASYVGLSLALYIPSAFALSRRLLIAGAALTLAVGIWGMHFIGMLALKTVVPIDYAILPTLLSFLVCVLVTGVAIYLASLRSQRLLVAAAVLMGLGVSLMHYVGMTAVHATLHMTHDPVFILASVIIAIAAAGLALWLAFSAERRPPLLLCALVLGCAISGMHYTAMAGTTFHLMASENASTKSLISSDVLAVIVSIVACTISAIFMLALIPSENARRDGSPWKETFEPADSIDAMAVVLDVPDRIASAAILPPPVEPVALAVDLLPIEKNGNKFHIAISDVASIHANAHYTYVFNGRDDLFCPLSISEIEERISRPGFFRTHRSYIVNLAFVVRIKKSGDAAIVELDTPIRRTVPVSRAKVTPLRQQLSLTTASVDPE